ncbi:MAG: right-handed parallel beta-helix repeat-containing protein, partial [Vicinamibacteraceae bacterium]
GLLAESATVEVDGLEITGAREAAVDLRAGARVTLSNSLIRDNEGSGVMIRTRAEPRLERNVIIHNGHGPQRRAGVVVEPGAAPVLEGNGIGGNGGEAVQGWPTAALPTLAQRNVLSPVPGSTPAVAPARPVPARPAPPARPRPGSGRE